MTEAEDCKQKQTAAEMMHELEEASQSRLSKWNLFFSIESSAVDTQRSGSSTEKDGNFLVLKRVFSL